MGLLDFGGVLRATQRSVIHLFLAMFELGGALFQLFVA